MVSATIHSVWIAQPATSPIAWSPASGDRAVSPSKQAPEHAGADSSLERAFEHIGNVAVVVFLLIERPPVHAFTKIDTCFAARQESTLSSH